MLKQTSESFRKTFILEFTKELIRNTEKYKELAIKNKVKKIFKEDSKKEKEQIEEKLPQREQIKKIIHGKIKEENKRVSNLKKGAPLEKSIENIKKDFQKNPEYPSVYPKQVKRPTRRSKYPFPYSPRTKEYFLPETIRDIRPVPTNKEINLGKLNALINDPRVKLIECLGPNQRIFVSGIMGRKITSTSLKKEEIEEVVEKFSESSRIPLQAGIVNIALGRLHLLSVISDITPPKFIIRKIPNIPPAFPGPYR